MEQVNNNEFIASSGIKVTINGDPSEEACKNFIKTAMDIYNKYLLMQDNTYDNTNTYIQQMR